MGNSLRFGESAIQAGYVTAEQVEDALAEQERRARRFELPLLGEVLVEKGHLTPHQVLELLHRQGVRLYRHPHQARQYNVVRARRDEFYACPVDGVRLIPVSQVELERLDIVGTIHPNGEVDLMQSIESVRNASTTSALPLPPTPAVQLAPPSSRSHADATQRGGNASSTTTAAAAEPTPERQVAPPGSLGTKQQPRKGSGDGRRQTERIPRRPVLPQSRDTATITSAGTNTTQPSAPQQPQSANKRPRDDGTVTYLPGRSRHTAAKRRAETARQANPSAAATTPQREQPQPAEDEESTTTAVTTTSVPTVAAGQSLPAPVHPEQLTAWQQLVQQENGAEQVPVAERVDAPPTSSESERLAVVPRGTVFSPTGSPDESDEDAYALGMLDSDPLLVPLPPQIAAHDSEEAASPATWDALDSDTGDNVFVERTREALGEDSAVAAAADAAVEAVMAHDSETDSDFDSGVTDDMLETAISFPPAEAMRDKPVSPGEDEMLETSLSAPPAEEMRNAPHSLEEAEDLARDAGVTGPFPALAGTGAEIGGVPEALPAESDELDPFARAFEEASDGANDEDSSTMLGEAMSSSAAPSSARPEATDDVDVSVPINPRSRRHRKSGRSVTDVHITTPPKRQQQADELPSQARQEQPGEPEVDESAVSLAEQQQQQPPTPAVPLPPEAGGFEASDDAVEEDTQIDETDDVGSTEPDGSSSDTLLEVSAAANTPNSDPWESDDETDAIAENIFAAAAEEQLPDGDPWESDDQAASASSEDSGVIAWFQASRPDYVELDDYPHADAPLTGHTRVESAESGEDWDGRFLALPEQPFTDVPTGNTAMIGAEELVLESADNEDDEDQITTTVGESPTPATKAAALDFTLRDNTTTVLPPPPLPESTPTEEASAEEDPHRDRVRKITAAPTASTGKPPKRDLATALQSLREQVSDEDETALLLLLALLARLEP